MSNASWRIVAYSLIFFIVTSLTIMWTRFAGGLALVWPGGAIAAALFLAIPQSRYAVAGGILIALSTLATSLVGFGPTWAFPLAVVNIAEGLLIATLLLHFRPQRDYVFSGKGVVWLGLVGGIVAPLLASIPGGMIASAIVGGDVFDHSVAWLVGHGLGTLLVLPLALLIAEKRRPFLREITQPLRAAQLLAMLALTLAICAAALLQSTFPSLFLPIVPLVLASFVFGRLGASITVLVIMAVAAGSLSMGIGVFAALDVPLWQTALFMQFYLAILLLISLPLAVALKQRSEMMRELVRREAMQRLISDHSDDALLHLDREGKVLFASPASKRLSGRSDIYDLQLTSFFNAADAKTVESALAAAALRPGHTEIFERSVDREGQVRWLEAKLRAVGSTSRDISSYVVTIRDVTARKMDELQASWEARTDALTGLPNRRAFLDILEDQLEFADEQPFALALIDLDHFKRVNDSHGHAVGDVVLRQVADIMRSLATDECFFARLGGEEFGFIAVGPACEMSSIICERLRLAVERHPMRDNDGGTFNITVSIGLAHVSDNLSTSVAMQAADGPLYTAKASGRNALRFAHGMGSKARTKAARQRAGVIAVHG